MLSERSLIAEILNPTKNANSHSGFREGFFKTGSHHRLWRFTHLQGGWLVHIPAVSFTSCWFWCSCPSPWRDNPQRKHLCALPGHGGGEKKKTKTLQVISKNLVSCWDGMVVHVSYTIHAFTEMIWKIVSIFSWLENWNDPKKCLQESSQNYYP